MNLVTALINSGWGRPSEAPDFEQNPPICQITLPPVASVGIDIGGTKTLITLACSNGLIETRVPTNPEGGQTVISEIVDAISRLADGRSIATVSVGLPGVIRADGTLAQAPNLPGFEKFSIASALSRSLDAPVSIHNDADLAAYAEHLWAGVNDLIFIAIGTGIGAGIISQGQILEGHAAAAGEIFDFPYTLDGTTIQLEELACGPGLERYYERLSGQAASSYEILGRVAVDPNATVALRELSRACAFAIAGASSVLNPGVIVLGGGFGATPQVSSTIFNHLEKLPARRTPIKISGLGPRAGAIGALAMALNRSDL